MLTFLFVLISERPLTEYLKSCNPNGYTMKILSTHINISIDVFIYGFMFVYSRMLNYILTHWSFCKYVFAYFPLDLNLLFGLLFTQFIYVILTQRQSTKLLWHGNAMYLTDTLYLIPYLNVALFLCRIPIIFIYSCVYIYLGVYIHSSPWANEKSSHQRTDNVAFQGNVKCL